MANRSYLYNTRDHDVNIPLDEIGNDIGLLWLLIFNIQDLYIRTDPENQDFHFCELITTREQALKNITSKQNKAIKLGFSLDIINCLEVIIAKLPYENLSADITEFSWFFSSEKEFREVIALLLDLSEDEVEYREDLCLFSLAEIYESLKIPLPEHIQNLHDRASQR